MINLMRADLYKLRRSTGARICVIFCTMAAIALVSISHFVAVGSLSPDITGSAAGLTEVCIISLFGSLIAGIIICSDFDTKTIHDAVACGRGRISVVCSKVLVYLIMIALLFLPYVIAVFIGICSGAEFKNSYVVSVFTNMLSDVKGSEVTAALMGNIISVSLVTILVHAARLSICIPIAFLVKKQVAVMGIGFASAFLFDFIFSLIKDVPVLGNILSVTPFNRKYILLTINSDTDLLIKAAVISIIFIAIMSFVTYRIFRRADIK